VKKVAFAIPGDIATATGGYAYAREVLKRLPACGIDAVHLALPDGYPYPSLDVLNQTGQLFMAQPWDTVFLVDGLAYGAFPISIAAGLAGRVVALVHHPLGLETGLPATRSAQMIAHEKAVLAYAAHVVVTGQATADILIGDFGIEADKLTVAVPGVTEAPRAMGSKLGADVQLLAVGSLVPRKGYDVLIDALKPYATLQWHLTIVGEERAAGLQSALNNQIAHAGLVGRITLSGGLDEAALDAAYATSDIFVMSSHYEGFGMVLTEALARGLPIVTTASGAGAATLPASAAQLVAVGDERAMGQALAHLISNPALRQKMADAAWHASSTLPRWESTALLIADVCRRIQP
jgi:glycosyltransferase involved in cell wall biosynthesis